MSNRVINDSIEFDSIQSLFLQSRVEIFGQLLFLEICLQKTNGDVGTRPGLDFEVLIESISAGVKYHDYDDVGRALLTAMLFGLELGMTRDVSEWPLRQTFARK